MWLQRNWDLLSRETREAIDSGRKFSTASTTALGSKRRDTAFSGKNCLVLFLYPWVKCLKIIISQKGFKNMTHKKK